MKFNRSFFACVCICTFLTMQFTSTLAAGDNRFQQSDVFELEYAADPQISPNGNRTVYTRKFMDIMKDRVRSNLWLIDNKTGEQRPLTTGNQNDSSPRFSPDGKKLIYVSSSNGTTQLYCRWIDTGEIAKLTNLLSSPSGIAWSPDGSQIAFSMLKPAEPKPFASLPKKPKGAEWAADFKVIRRTAYRADGQGYLKHGYRHLYVIPADGGTPRQLTSGEFHHRGRIAWSADGKSLVVSANRSKDWELEPRQSDLYSVSLANGSIKQLTDRNGPDAEPTVSPDGTKIAYTGFNDEKLSYQITRLSILNLTNGKSRTVTTAFDRDVNHPVWSSDGQGLYFQFDDLGTTKIGYVKLDGTVQVVADDVGGTTIGRPYASGSFSVSNNGTVAFTQTQPNYPADVAIDSLQNKQPKKLTALNDDLFGHKQLGNTEELWFKSSHDGRKIQAWVVTPPGFDKNKKYPLILEIHGGPFANYGNRFSAEVQLYATAGYVVVYVNPRGSTGYGQEFANLIHLKYPGHDFDDLMSGVDAVIEKGFIDSDRLFVTGGSGGGILTAWVVGKTGRFRAAVAAKPVINWYSFALTSDGYAFFTQYWFPGFPWDHAEHYLKRSPLSLVGNVTTPTMLLTGEQDYRTPISESEQFYQALKLRKIDTALVRVPGSSHSIAARPSHLISKVAHILKWFEMH